MGVTNHLLTGMILQVWFGFAIARWESPWVVRGVCSNHAACSQRNRWRWAMKLTLEVAGLKRKSLSHGNEMRLDHEVIWKFLDPATSQFAAFGKCCSKTNRKLTLRTLRTWIRGSLNTSGFDFVSTLVTYVIYGHWVYPPDFSKQKQGHFSIAPDEPLLTPLVGVEHLS